MTAASKYRGVARIVAYNRAFYAASALAICGLAIAMLWAPPTARIAIAIFLAAAFYWTVASLLASHWVYDRSSLYSPDWLTVRPVYWLNIHAGLDEMSSLIENVLDVFDPKEMTEPSIARAREMSFPDLPPLWYGRFIGSSSGSCSAAIRGETTVSTAGFIACSPRFGFTCSR